MQIVLVISLAAVLGGCIGMWRYDIRRERHANNRIDDLKAQRKADAQLIAELGREDDMKKAEIMHLNARLAEAEKRLAGAVDSGGRAAKLMLDTVERERGEALDSIAAWMHIANVAVMAATQPKALPRAVEAPKPLPSGEHFLVEAEPPLLLQVES